MRRYQDPDQYDLLLATLKDSKELYSVLKNENSRSKRIKRLKVRREILPENNPYYDK